jgi:rRNA maturation endonuclease Nob1
MFDENMLHLEVIKEFIIAGNRIREPKRYNYQCQECGAVLPYGESVFCYDCRMVDRMMNQKTS